MLSRDVILETLAIQEKRLNALRECQAILKNNNNQSVDYQTAILEILVPQIQYEMKCYLLTAIYYVYSFYEEYNNTNNNSIAEENLNQHKHKVNELFVEIQKNDYREILKSAKDTLLLLDKMHTLFNKEIDSVTMKINDHKNKNEYSSLSFKKTKQFKNNSVADVVSETLVKLQLIRLIVLPDMKFFYAFYNQDNIGCIETLFENLQLKEKAQITNKQPETKLRVNSFFGNYNIMQRRNGSSDLMQLMLKEKRKHDEVEEDTTSSLETKKIKLNDDEKIKNQRRGAVELSPGFQFKPPTKN